MSSKHILSTLGLAAALAVSIQAHAGKTVEVVCGDGKVVQVDKVKNSPLAQAMRCKQAGHPAPAQKPMMPPQTFKKKAGGENKALLLPAVQAAREAARPAKPKVIKPRSINKTFGQSGDNPAADTSCSGVAACNDMIATCISLGGNVSPTSYEPGTGSPNGATCYSPGG